MTYSTSSNATDQGYDSASAEARGEQYCPCCAGAYHHGLPPAYHNPDHKPILAERFKTKMCRNYEQTGSCPYVHRCMFAHGDFELRTKAMNLADGLVTEEAIKNFKRANYEAHRAAYGMVAPSESSSMRSTPPPTPMRQHHHVYRHDPYAQFSAWQPISPMTPVYRSSLVLSRRSHSPNDIVESAIADLELSPASGRSSVSLE